MSRGDQSSLCVGAWPQGRQRPSRPSTLPSSDCRTISRCRSPSPSTGSGCPAAAHGSSTAVLTLQEVKEVVPVLVVNKKRKSDIRPVTVEVWPESNKITTGQVAAVRLFQSEPVSDKVQRHARSVPACNVGDTLISSNPRRPDFRPDSSTDKRDRYQSGARMLLSQDADNYNNRAVEFRLEEQIPNTSQWRVYARAPYTLKLSFTSEFDF